MKYGHKVGKNIYTATQLRKSDHKPQFKGYELSKDGYPTLIYTLSGTTLHEKITTDGELIIRTITASPSIPQFLTIRGNEKLQVTQKETGNILTITYKAL